MGTKVHCASYVPGSYTMMDLNENADGYWSQYYGDKTLSRNNYNVYQLRPSNGYSEYDKEMLKRTMLEHEAIFRKQVYELHRLYRIQKDMMNEFKKGSCRVEATSHPIFFSSQIPSESMNGLFQMPTQIPSESMNGLFQMPTASNNRTPYTVIDDKETILNFLHRNGKEIGIKDGGMLESDHKGPKRMFDLQFPADAYIDCEKVDRSEREIVDASSSIMNNAKLTLGMVEGPNSREESLMSHIRAQSGPTTRSLADLNEPAKEICFGTGVGSVSTKFLCSKTPSAENQGLLLPMRSNTSFSGIPSAFLKGKHWDEGTSLNHLHAADDDETSQEWSFFNKQAGQITGSGRLFNQGSFKEKFSMPSERIQLNQKPHDILSLDQNKRETWFMPKLETSQRNLHYGQSATPFSNPSSNALLDYTSAASPLLSSWTKPENGYGHNYGRDLSSHSRVGIDSTYYQKGYNHHSSASQLHTKPITFGNLEGCRPQKSQIDVNLNQTLLDGFHNGLTTQKDNGSETNSSLALPWFRQKPTCKSSYVMELDLSQGYPQLKMNSRYERRHEIEKNVNLFNLQDLPSSSQVKKTTMEVDVASDGQCSKKIFGFSIPEKTQQTVATEYNEKDKSKISFEDLGAKSFRNHINLNIDLNSSDLPAECEMLEVPLQQASAPFVAPKIDLEAPIVLEEENADDNLIREAAKIILLISSDKLPLVSYSALHWFAEVVSSSVDDEKENSDYTLDSFELMTLHLEETKPEEYLCPSWEERNQEDDGDDDDGKSSIASLLFTKPRRGQARKRRKRDFQKDILPGLASLSRHEVMEDLQTIGGTMRRNSNRNGTNCRGRKPRSLAITVEEIPTPPPPPPLPLEVEIDGKNMIGWGRTTRRCRRQRFAPITNVAAPLT